MADGIRLEIKGLPELIKKIEELKGDAENSVAVAMMAAATYVAGEAKRRAPVFTGNLSRSITATGKQDGKIDHTSGAMPDQSISTIRSSLQRTGSAEAYIGTNVVYAPPQEFLPFAHKHGQSPYLRPALDESRNEVRRQYRTALEQIIQRAGK
jgi:HK97 gp10 family phage protein